MLNLFQHLGRSRNKFGMTISKPMIKKTFLLGSLFSSLLLLGAGCINLGGSTATGPMGMYRSLDKGDTWQQANVYPTVQGVKSLGGVKAYRLFTDPSDPNALYLATRGQGLFYTYDKGDSWQVATAMNGKFIYALAVDPKNKCTILASDGGHIYKSTDCSRSWSLAYNNDQADNRVVALAYDFGNSKNIYAGLLGGEVLLSTDGGTGWKVIKNFKKGTALQVLVTAPLTPGRLYAASTQDGLARSDDGGATWINLNEGLNNFNDSLNFYRLVLHPSEKGIIFWVSKYGILRSNDAGKTWTDLKLLTPPGSVNIYAFAISPSNPKEMYYVGTILQDKGASRSTFYKSVDGGNSWVTKKLPTNTIPVTLLIHPTDTKTLFMGFTVPEK